MDLRLAGLVETLAPEFAELRSGTVVAVATDCLHSLPRADPYFVEQASRARLRLLSRAPKATHHGHPDRSDLSYQRLELAEEGALTSRLMDACRKSCGPLPTVEVDRILGTRAAR